MALAAAYVRRNIRYLLPWQWAAGVKALYRRLSGSGIFLTRDELGMCSLHPRQKIDKILRLVEPTSILDVGCGVGRTTVYLTQLGFEAIGVEASRVAIRNSDRPDLIYRHDLRRPLDLKRMFDLVWCFEVAEHIHPRFVGIFVESLTRALRRFEYSDLR